MDYCSAARSGSVRELVEASAKWKSLRSGGETGKGSEGVREVWKRSGRPWESAEEAGRHGK